MDNNNTSSVNNEDMKEDSVVEEYYDVEAIVEKKKFGTKCKYLIKWVGWPINSCTWEPIENLNCEQIVEDFEKTWTESHPSLNEVVKNPLEKRGRPKKNPLAEKNISENDNFSSHGSDTDNDKNIQKKRGRPKKLTSENDVSKYSINYNLKSKKEEKSENFIGKNVVNNENLIENNNDGNLVNTGSLENDVPFKLKSCKRLGTKVNLLVEWNVRGDGCKPENSYVLNHDLRKKYSDLLLDFYESKLTFPGEKK